MTPDPRAAEVVDRWLLHGGAVTVLSRTAGSVVVGLLRCDGGEQVDTVVMDAAAWDSRSET